MEEELGEVLLVDDELVAVLELLGEGCGSAGSACGAWQCRRGAGDVADVQLLDMLLGDVDVDDALEGLPVLLLDVEDVDALAEEVEVLEVVVELVVVGDVDGRARRARAGSRAA